MLTAIQPQGAGLQLSGRSGRSRLRLPWMTPKKQEINFLGAEETPKKQEINFLGATATPKNQEFNFLGAQGDA